MTQGERPEWLDQKSQYQSRSGRHNGPVEDKEKTIKKQAIEILEYLRCNKFHNGEGIVTYREKDNLHLPMNPQTSRYFYGKVIQEIVTSFDSFKRFYLKVNDSVKKVTITLEPSEEGYAKLQIR